MLLLETHLPEPDVDGVAVGPAVAAGRGTATVRSRRVAAESHPMSAWSVAPPSERTSSESSSGADGGQGAFLAVA